jgi:hypothetical protein
MGSDQPTIVLVHGAWADATSFGEVMRALHRDGYSCHFVAWEQPEIFTSEVRARSGHCAERSRTRTEVDVADSHSSAGASQFEGDRTADPATGAGDGGEGSP